MHIETKITQKKLFDQVAHNFSKLDSCYELVQNAYRAEATNIHLYYDKVNNELTIEDDGHGFDTHAWQNLLNFPASNWINPEVEKQHPAGYGLRAFLFSTTVTITSGKYTLTTTPEIIHENKAELEKTNTYQKGTKITIRFKTDYKFQTDSIYELVHMHFALNGEKINIQYTEKNTTKTIDNSIPESISADQNKFPNIETPEYIIQTKQKNTNSYYTVNQTVINYHGKQLKVPNYGNHSYNIILKPWAKLPENIRPILPTRNQWEDSDAAFKWAIKTIQNHENEILETARKVDRNPNICGWPCLFTNIEADVGKYEETQSIYGNLELKVEQKRTHHHVYLQKPTEYEDIQIILTTKNQYHTILPDFIQDEDEPPQNSGIKFLQKKPYGEFTPTNLRACTTTEVIKQWATSNPDVKWAYITEESLNNKYLSEEANQWIQERLVEIKDIELVLPFDANITEDPNVTIIKTNEIQVRFPKVTYIAEVENPIPIAYLPHTMEGVIIPKGKKLNKYEVERLLYSNYQPDIGYAEITTTGQLYYDNEHITNAIVKITNPKTLEERIASAVKKALPESIPTDNWKNYHVKDLVLHHGEVQLLNATIQTAETTYKIQYKDKKWDVKETLRS